MLVVIPYLAEKVLFVEDFVICSRLVSFFNMKLVRICFGSLLCCQFGYIFRFNFIAYFTDWKIYET